MPTSFEIDTKRRLVISSGSGRVVVEEMIEHQRRLQADPRFQPDFSQLVDFTGTEKVDISPQDVARLAELALFAPTARRAIIAANPLVFGFSRMYGMFRELAGEKGIRVFRTREEAMRWIDQTEETQEAGSPI
jgi:hypothetical protein